ncbi:MAG: restriction endonuclease [Candidatus Eremiobacteraeota bacterium]|nr:restriction endonuclease [Candidatus Eremiobacteraeota bacterium]
MKAWTVRAGSDGENEDLDLNDGIVAIGWSETGDLTGVSREKLRTILEEKHPDASAKRIINWTGQVWSFISAIEVDDLAVLPLKRRAAIALGRFTSNYTYRPEYMKFDAVHTRHVKWLKTDLPRTAFPQDLLDTLGSFLTVFRAERNNAASRLEALANGLPLPPSLGSVPTSHPPPVNPAEAVDAFPDLERRGRDLIVSMIDQQFKAHDLERLVEAILVADGFHVNRTRAGADGGVDLLAGRGELGFDAPRVCVQVKSGKSAEDVKSVRELQGALKNFGADQGLFISWGGYTNTVYAEARRSFFQIRLWTADHLVDALLRVYDRLSAEMRAEIPLKRIWAPAIDSNKD